MMNSCPDTMTSYTVQAGDTLWMIARRFQTTVDAILSANRNLTTDNLKVGQTICVPRRGRSDSQPYGSPSRCPMGLRTYTIQLGDTLWKLSQTYGTTVETIMAINPGIDPNYLMEGQVIWLPDDRNYRNASNCTSFLGESDHMMEHNQLPDCREGYQSYVVQPGDTLWLLSNRYQTTVEALMAANPEIQSDNLFIGQVICVPSFMGNMRPQPIPRPGAPTTMRVSKEEQNLNNYLRLLWLENVFWLRMALESMIFKLPDVGISNARLMQNAKDFEMALMTFYGNENGSEFSELLSNHLMLGNEIAMALMDSNTSRASDLEKQWYENGNQMAVFLNSMNPNWPKEVLENRLRDYLDTIKKVINSIMAGDFEEGVTALNDLESQVMELADTMTDGIVMQFPQYFK